MPNSYFYINMTYKIYYYNLSTLNLPTCIDSVEDFFPYKNGVSAEAIQSFYYSQINSSCAFNKYGYISQPSNRMSTCGFPWRDEELRVPLKCKSMFYDKENVGGSFGPACRAIQHCTVVAEGEAGQPASCQPVVADWAASANDFLSLCSQYCNYDDNIVTTNGSYVGSQKGPNSLFTTSSTGTAWSESSSGYSPSGNIFPNGSINYGPKGSYIKDPCRYNQCDQTRQDKFYRATIVASDDQKGNRFGHSMQIVDHPSIPRPYRCIYFGAPGQNNNTGAVGVLWWSMNISRPCANLSDTSTCHYWDLGSMNCGFNISDAVRGNDNFQQRMLYPNSYMFDTPLIQVDMTTFVKTLASAGITLPPEGLLGTKVSVFSG